MDIDALLGQIQLFAFGFAPNGWMQCQGQTMQVMQNQALFSLIGATWENHFLSVKQALTA